MNIEVMTAVVLLTVAYTLSQSHSSTEPIEVVTPLAAARHSSYVPPVTTPFPLAPLQEDNDPTRYKEAAPPMAGGIDADAQVEHPLPADMDAEPVSRPKPKYKYTYTYKTVKKPPVGPYETANDP